MSNRGNIRQKYTQLRDKYHNEKKRYSQLIKSIEHARKKIKSLKRENSYLLESIVDMSPDLIQEMSDSSDDDSVVEGSDEPVHTASDASANWPGPTRYDEIYEEGRDYENEKEDDYPKERSTSRNRITEPYWVDNRQIRRGKKRPDTPVDSPEMPMKRRRKTGKRDDRTQAKPVEDLPHNSDGSLKLPVVVGKGNNEVTIIDIGKVVWDRDTYHTHRYIWPVGFKSQKVYASLKDIHKKTVWTSEIKDGGDAPIFQVVAEDMPDAQPFQASSSSAVWKQILDEIQAKGMTAKTHASGPEMLGLTNLGITKFIQELPGAELCSKYVMQKWVIAGENPSSAPSRQNSGDTDPLLIVQEHPEEKEKTAVVAAIIAKED